MVNHKHAVRIHRGQLPPAAWGPQSAPRQAHTRGQPKEIQLPSSWSCGRGGKRGPPSRRYFKSFSTKQSLNKWSLRLCDGKGEKMMVYQEKFVVSIKVGGRILRERDKEHVYLPFGTEYSILLKNLSGKKASVRIEIDGEDVLSGHSLIIGPGKTTELERFIINSNLNKGPRFKFIEKTEQISEHRGDRIDDGIIRVSYQFEETPYFRTSIIPEIHHHHYNSNDWVYGGSKSFGSSNNVRSCFSSHVTGQSVTSEQVNQSNLTEDSLSDDGITVKGGESNQSFQYGYIGVLETEIHSICLKLHGTHEKGIVHAPLTVKTKLKCEICGNTNTSLNKFCGGCGNNLNW